MLDHVTGEVLAIKADRAIVSVGGVGLEIKMSSADLALLDGRVTIYTVLAIKDEELNLYGFRTEQTRELFHALCTVPKVGPKVALAILSFHSPTDLERAIASSDAGAFSLVSGVGPKLADRIILELRDRFGAVTAGARLAIASGPISEVRDALVALGYSATEANAALADLPSDGDTDTLLRHALKSLEPVKT